MVSRLAFSDIVLRVEVLGEELGDRREPLDKIQSDHVPRQPVQGEINQHGILPEKLFFVQPAVPILERIHRCEGCFIDRMQKLGYVRTTKRTKPDHRRRLPELVRSRRRLQRPVVRFSLTRAILCAPSPLWIAEAL